MTRATATMLVTASIVLMSALAIASQAGAATLYVCVKKGSGTPRFVSARTRCRRNETKLAWNTSGPAGKNGTNGKNGASGKNGKDGTAGKNGTNGANGANGTSVGYFDFNDAQVELPTTRTTIASLLSVPPGSYVLTANVQVEDANPAVAVVVKCFLAGDEAVAELKDAGGVATVSLMAAGTTPFTSAFTLECDSSGTKEVKVKFARLVAIQVQTLSSAG